MAVTPSSLTPVLYKFAYIPNLRVGPRVRRLKLDVPQAVTVLLYLYRTVNRNFWHQF